MPVTSHSPTRMPGGRERAIEGFGLLFAAFFCIAVGYAVAHAAHGSLTIWQLLACRAVVYLVALAPWAVRHP